MSEFICRHLYKSNLDKESSFGLFTSSSFAVRGFYTFDKSFNHPANQSLLRINTTGSSNQSKKESVIINLVATTGSLTAFISDCVANNEVKSVVLNNINIFDGDLWAVSLSKKADVKTKFNDSYSLGASKYNDGKRQSYYYTSSFIAKSAPGDSSVLSVKSAQYNSSGSFITIGSQSLGGTGKFINKSSTEIQKSTIFSGEVSYLNFWSSYKTEDEFIGYSKNPNSVGSMNPAINYNFSNLETGSFERMRIQTHGKQGTTDTDNDGRIRLFDFSQNNLHFDCRGFEPNKTVMTPNHIIF